MTHESDDEMSQKKSGCSFCNNFTATTNEDYEVGPKIASMLLIDFNDSYCYYYL